MGPRGRDLLKPKSTGFNTTSGLLLFQVTSHCHQGFRFYHADIHIHTLNIHHDEVIAISAPPYDVVGTDKKLEN